MFNWTFLNVVGIVGGGVECFRAIFVGFYFLFGISIAVMLVVGAVPY